MTNPHPSPIAAAGARLCLPSIHVALRSMKNRALSPNTHPKADGACSIALAHRPVIGGRLTS